MHCVHAIRPNNIKLCLNIAAAKLQLRSLFACDIGKLRVNFGLSRAFRSQVMVRQWAYRTGNNP